MFELVCLILQRHSQFSAALQFGVLFPVQPSRNAHPSCVPSLVWPIVVLHLDSCRQVWPRNLTAQSLELLRAPSVCVVDSRAVIFFQLGLNCVPSLFSDFAQRPDLPEVLCYRVCGISSARPLSFASPQPRNLSSLFIPAFPSDTFLRPRLQPSKRV